MSELFQKIHREESNENTALILMLGVLSDKLSKIIAEIKEANKVSSELLLLLKTAKEGVKKEIVIIEPMLDNNSIN